MSQRTTIFVYLHNEGTDVWRPVEATDSGQSIYRITSMQEDPEEHWEFHQGELVRCETRLIDDRDVLVAVERIESEPLEERTIDGARFKTLSEFYDEVERVLIPGATWGRNLNAFNDILRGGFGTPDEGFVLVWKHAETSRTSMNSPGWPSGAAEQTVFEALVEYIELHGPGGEEAEDNVHLRLE